MKRQSCCAPGARPGGGRLGGLHGGGGLGMALQGALHVPRCKLCLASPAPQNPHLASSKPHLWPPGPSAASPPHPAACPAPEGPLPSLSRVGAGWQGAPGPEPRPGDTRLPEGGADLEAAEEAHSPTPPTSARAEPVARLPPHIRSSEPAGLRAGLLRWRQPRSGPGGRGAAGRQAGWEDLARECGPGQTVSRQRGTPQVE